MHHLVAAITMTPQLLTIAGLTLDIVGVVLLLLLPPELFKAGFLVIEQSRRSERVDSLRRRIWWIGPVFIVLGFGLQIVANVIEIF